MITNQNLKDAARAIGLEWQAEADNMAGLILADGTIWRPHMVKNHLRMAVPRCHVFRTVPDEESVLVRIMIAGKGANCRVRYSQFMEFEFLMRPELAAMEAAVLALAALGAVQ